MKRILSVWLSLCLVMIGCFSASASRNILTVSGPTACKPGTNITLSFGLVGGTNVDSLSVIVEYDSSAFTFVDYRTCGITNGALKTGNGDKAGEFKFSLITINPITAGGTLFTITFAVKANAPLSSYNFFFYGGPFSKADGSEITPSGKNYTVSVQKEIASSKPTTSKPSGSQSVVSKPVASAPAASKPTSQVTSAPVASKPGASTPSGSTVSSAPVVSNGNNSESAQPQGSPVVSTAFWQGPKLGVVSRSWTGMIGVALGATITVIGAVFILLAIAGKKMKKANADSSITEEKNKK